MSTKNGEEERQGMNQQQQIEGQSKTNQLLLNNINNNNSKNDIPSRAYDDRQTECKIMSFNDNHCQDDDYNKDVASYYKGGSSSSGSEAISASTITTTTAASTASTASAVHDGNDDRISNQMKTIESRKSSGKNLDDIHPLSTDHIDEIKVIGSSVTLVERNNVVITEIVESDD
jgi:hypothetical protein